MPFYETVFIVEPSVGPDEIDKESEKLEAAIASGGGRVIGRDVKGKQRLAYPIAHHTEGHYVYLTFEGQGEIVPVLERIYRLDERILRFLTIRLESAPPERPEQPPSEQEAKAEPVEPTAAAPDEEEEKVDEAEKEKGAAAVEENEVDEEDEAEKEKGAAAVEENEEDEEDEEEKEEGAAAVEEDEEDEDEEDGDSADEEAGGK